MKLGYVRGLQFPQSVGSATAKALQCYVKNSQRKYLMKYDRETKSQEQSHARLTNF